MADIINAIPKVVDCVSCRWCSGTGRLFEPDAGRYRMQLLEARPLATGGTIL